MWEKEKMLLTSILSVVHYVFYPIKDNLQHLSPCFNASAVFWKNWVKEKFLKTSNFSFSNSLFYLFWQLSAIFIKVEIVIYKLFPLEESKIYQMRKG